MKTWKPRIPSRSRRPAGHCDLRPAVGRSRQIDHSLPRPRLGSYQTGVTSTIKIIIKWFKYSAIIFCIANTASVALFFHKILHKFLHNNIIKKDLKFLFTYFTILHKVLQSIIAAFIAQSIVLYCTKYCSVLHKALFCFAPPHHNFVLLYCVQMCFCILHVLVFVLLILV